MAKCAVIVGGGPAGLTAALELLKETEVKPIVFELSDQPGGISKTVCVKGFRMDMGGHRFFSKSKKIMDWWKSILPPAGAPAKDDIALGRTLPLFPEGPNPEETDEVMLIRKRLSRIMFERKFYPYPLSLSSEVFTNLGILRTAKAGCNYLKSKLFPITPENTLEDFLINRFGNTLYELFFKDYTYKVWDKSCKEISAEWGKQRIKGLSLGEVLRTALLSPLRSKEDLYQESLETSLIHYFLYPKFGPGQLWESVATKILNLGGEIHYNTIVREVIWDNFLIEGVVVEDLTTNIRRKIKADFVLSSAPIKDFVLGLHPKVPSNIAEIAVNLPYRDFITIGVYVKDFLLDLRDNWIYIQEPDLKVGRLQIFNNWSPYLLPAGSEGLWVGMEYFANKGDDLWSLDDRMIEELAIRELRKIGIIADESEVSFCHTARVEKAYPAYWGRYDDFGIIVDFTNKFKNLFLIGRGGMHRYNNQDHSMLSAMEAVKNIKTGEIDKENIWLVNAEEEYHEEGKFR